MAKKEATLTVLEGAGNRREVPASLGKAGAKLWQSVQSEYQINDAGGLETLFQICTAADSAQQYASAIERDGATIQTKGGLKDHPLIRHEIAARSFVVRSLHRLGLDIEPTRNVMGRPPSTFNKPR